MWENVLGSLLAMGLVGAIALANGRLSASSSYFWPVVGLLVALIVIGSWLIVVRRRYVPFVSYMSNDDLRRRIDDAGHAIWSFQISGGEFTQSACRHYEGWLRADGSRQLKVLFANPENEGLLRGIVELSGMGARSTQAAAISYLRDTIRTSLARYESLAQQCADQVEVRVYDGSPPCSIHAVDVTHKTARASIFVENYLPRTAWTDRPCFLLVRPHRLFALYAQQCGSWFDEAQPYAGRVAGPVG